MKNDNESLLNRVEQGKINIKKLSPSDQKQLLSEARERDRLERLTTVKEYTRQRDDVCKNYAATKGEHRLIIYGRERELSGEEEEKTIIRLIHKWDETFGKEWETIERPSGKEVNEFIKRAKPTFKKLHEAYGLKLCEAALCMKIVPLGRDKFCSDACAERNRKGKYKKKKRKTDGKKRDIQGAKKVFHKISRNRRVVHQIVMEQNEDLQDMLIDKAIETVKNTLNNKSFEGGTGDD